MTTKIVKLGATTLCAILFCVAGCASKPRSTTTTNTHTTTELDNGEKTNSDVKTTTREERDGTQTVKRTETTSQSPTSH
ncbi:MAG TPA: hypothetical protein VGC42_17720 [Kofleriaceae bacterium]